MNEYTNFGLGPLKERLDAAGNGWIHICDQAHNTMVWLLSPCAEDYLTTMDPKTRWKYEYRKKRAEAKGRVEKTLRGEIGHIYGCSFVRS